MTLSFDNRWGAAAACSFGAAMIIFSPIAFRATNYLAFNRGWMSDAAGPTVIGFLIHVTALFFAIFGILSLNWACS